MAHVISSLTEKTLLLPSSFFSVGVDELRFRMAKYLVHPPGMVQEESYPSCYLLPMPWFSASLPAHVIVIVIKVEMITKLVSQWINAIRLFIVARYWLVWFPKSYGHVNSANAPYVLWNATSYIIQYTGSQLCLLVEDFQFFK